MAEELRIVVTDSGGGGSGGGGGRGVGPVGVGGGGFRAPSVVQQTFAQSVTQGIGLGVGTTLTGLAIQAAKYTIGSPYYATRAAIRTMNSQVSDLSGLSAPLAERVAESNMAAFNLRARRANALGGALASFEGTRSRIATAFGDTGTEIYKLLLGFFEVVKPLIEKGVGYLERVDDVIRGLPMVLDKIINNLPFVFSFLRDPLITMSTTLKKMHKAQEDAEKEGGFFDQLMGNLATVGFWPGDQKLPGPDRQELRRRRRAGF